MNYICNLIYNIVKNKHFCDNQSLNWKNKNFVWFVDCKKLLGESLILLGEIGGNDYNHPFFEGINFETIQDLVPYVINTIGLAIKVRTSFKSKLYSLVVIYDIVIFFKLLYKRILLYSLMHHLYSLIREINIIKMQASRLTNCIKFYLFIEYVISNPCNAGANSTRGNNNIGSWKSPDRLLPILSNIIRGFR